MAGCDLTASTVAALATSGPRYTSYPPATEFRPLGAGVVADEVTALGAAGAPVGLYVHVPFCHSLCWYCGCNVTITRDPQAATAYVDMLLAQVELELAGDDGALMAAQALAARHGPIDGGGTRLRMPRPRALAPLLADIESAGATVVAMRTVTADLQAVFLAVTGHTLRD